MRFWHRFGAIVGLVVVAGALSPSPDSHSPIHAPVQDRRPEPRPAHAAPDAPAQLAPSDLQPTSTPERLGYAGFTGGTTGRTTGRAGSARFHAPLRPVHADPSAATRATLLRLRAAAHDSLAVRAALARNANGAASFHTNKPPPPAIVG